jgi:Peptidase A4 family
MRPDSGSARYSSWLENVSKPYDITGPGAPDVSDVRFNQEIDSSSQPWSGELVGNVPGYNYVAVFGAWTVPTTTVETSVYTLVGEWIGIDGASPQCGTVSTAPNFNGNPNPAYQWFYENPASDPKQPNGNGQPVPATVFSNPSLTGGQGVECELYIGDQADNLNPGSTFVWLYFANNSTTQNTGWFAGQYQTIPANYQGATAAYIIERAQNSAGLVPLANYGFASMPYHDALYNNGVWSNGGYNETLTFYTMMSTNNQYPLSVNSYQIHNGTIAWAGGWQGDTWEGYQ